jgi:hypothetical protein
MPALARHKPAHAHPRERSRARGCKTASKKKSSFSRWFPHTRCAPAHTVPREVALFPVASVSGSTIFAYVEGNPLMYTDPEGLAKVRPGGGRPRPTRDETPKPPQPVMNNNNPLLIILDRSTEPAGNLINSITGQNRYPSIDTTAPGFLQGPQTENQGRCTLIPVTSSNSCPATPAYRLWCGSVIGPR